MPCNHKFKKHLNLTHLDFEPTTLIVGTFIPEWPDGTTGEWFYGNIANNNFWNVLPRLYGAPSLINATPADWKQFCHDNRIAITDIISTIDDADPDDPKQIKILAGFADDALAYNFEDFVYVNIVQILRQHPTIKNVYLTRGVTESFWRHLWNPVMHYCHLNNIRERKLLTPSINASVPQEVYNGQNPGGQIPLLEDYILMKWKQEWHL